MTRFRLARSRRRGGKAKSHGAAIESLAPLKMKLTTPPAPARFN